MQLENSLLNKDERVCPKCGSDNVHQDPENIFMFKVNPSIWECKNCSYKGLMPRKDDEHQEKPVESRYFLKILLTIITPLVIYVLYLTFT